MIGVVKHRFRSAPEAVWSRLAVPPGIDTVVASFALILGSGVFNDELLSSWPYAIAIRQTLWLSIYVFVIVWLCRRFGYEWLLWSARHLPLMCLILAIAFASTLWSLEPSLTFRRSASLIASTLIGIFLGYNFAPRALMRILFWVFAGLLVVSAFTSIAFPESATVDTHRVGNTLTTWQGLFQNKNQLGSVAGVASLFFFVATLYGRANRYFGMFLLILALVMLLMSQAATAYVAAFAGIFVASSFAIARRLRFPALVTFFYLVFGLVCAAWITTFAIDEFTQLLARDSTLTKRTVIWADALEIIAYHPWVGYGYEAVWGKGEETWFPSLATASWAASAHNGFLTIATELGLPTMVLAVIHFLVMLIASVYAYLRHRSPTTLFAVSYMFMSLIANLPESFYFSPGFAYWIVYVAISTMTMRVLTPAANNDRPANSGRRRGRRLARRRASGTVTARITAAASKELGRDASPSR